MDNSNNGLILYERIVNQINSLYFDKNNKYNGWFNCSVDSIIAGVYLRKLDTGDKEELQVFPKNDTSVVLVYLQSGCFNETNRYRSITVDIDMLFNYFKKLINCSDGYSIIQALYNIEVENELNKLE